MELTMVICGEGKNDFGQGLSCETWEEGTVQVIIRKILPDISIKFLPISKGMLKRDEKSLVLNPGLKKSGVKKGHAIKVARLCAFIGINQQYKKNDLVIYYTDADKDEGQRAAKNKQDAQEKFEEIRNEILKSFEMHPKINGIPMIPFRMLECWLLGDENAYRECFGSCPSNPALPKNPEYSIWGDEDDSNSDHPKNYIKRVLKQCKEYPCTDIYKYIAENIDVENLKNNCYISFKKFCEDLEEATA